MPEALQIVCPHCDMSNRISRSAPRWGAAELQSACQSACEHSIAIHFGLLDMAAEGYEAPVNELAARPPVGTPGTCVGSRQAFSLPVVCVTARQSAIAFMPL